MFQLSCTPSVLGIIHIHRGMSCTVNSLTSLCSAIGPCSMYRSSPISGSAKVPYTSKVPSSASNRKFANAASLYVTSMSQLGYNPYMESLKTRSSSYLYASYFSRNVAPAPNTPILTSAAVLTHPRNPFLISCLRSCTMSIPLFWATCFHSSNRVANGLANPGSSAGRVRVICLKAR